MPQIDICSMPLEKHMIKEIVVKSKKNPIFILNLLAIMTVLFCCQSRVSSAEQVADDVVLREMKFIERIAARGYFNIAKEAKDKAKKIPGLTTKQKNFLDLVQSSISIRELIKEKNIEKRKEKLASTIDYLNKTIGELPDGSPLLLQAKCKVVLTYGDAADVFVADAEQLEFKIKIYPDDGSYKEERAALLALAQESYASGISMVPNLRKELLDMYNQLADKHAYESNKKLKKKYYSMFEMAFFQEVQFEHDAANMYANYAKSYPRGSEEREKIYTEAYWFCADIAEFHHQFLPYDVVEAQVDIMFAGLMDEPLLENIEKEKNKGKAAVIISGANVPTPIQLMNREFESK